GTFSVAGGCAAGIHGAVTGFQVSQVSGTFTGAFTAGGANIGISAVLSQGTASNTFGLSGTATFTNCSACGLPSANITAFETGFIAGTDVRAGMLDSTVTPVGTLRGTVSDGTATTIMGTFAIPTGRPCAGTSVSVTLTKIS